MQTVDQKQLAKYCSYSDWVFLQVVATFTAYDNATKRFFEKRIAALLPRIAFPPPDGELPRNWIEERYNNRLGNWFMQENKNIIINFVNNNPVLRNALLVHNWDSANPYLLELGRRLHAVKIPLPATLVAAIVIRIMASSS